jgi:cytoskeletal protein CcmA (bactofilin family)
MFGNKDKSFENIKDAETVIGPGIRVKGNFHGKGNIIIEGSLEGSIKTDSSLLIAEKAKVKADIKANEAIINGSVNGNVDINKTLSLGKTASVKGDVVCAQISINQGAKINGNFAMHDTSDEKDKKENKTTTSGKDNSKQ